MMTFFNWIVVWVLSALVITLAAYLIPGVRVKNFWIALLVAIVLGFVNIFIRPFLAILAFPITVLTLGLFAFVINALMVLLTAAIVPAFKVDGFWNALLFSIIVSIGRIFIAMLFSV